MVGWDKNGNIAANNAENDITYTFNWDNKLRKAEWPGNNSIEIKYDPSGNRIWKKSTAAGSATTRKYVVDIVGDLPTILLEIEPSPSSLTKTYIYADSQILAQHDGDHTAERYFYLHDRLGSVRQVINSSGSVRNSYTYEPFGEAFASEIQQNVTSPFMFAGQYFDSEIEEYYLRARQYNPGIARFTSRDPIFGRFKEPLTLHGYLYCLNDPVNRTDPTGETSLAELKATITGYATAFGGAAYNFGGKVMDLARNVYYSAMVRAADINMWMGQYIYGYGGQNKPTSAFSAGQLKQFQGQLARDGVKSLLRSKASLSERLLKHSKDVLEYEFKGSVEVEIQNFREQIAAIDYVLTHLDEFTDG